MISVCVTDFFAVSSSIKLVEMPKLHSCYLKLSLLQMKIYKYAGNVNHTGISVYVF